MRYRRTGLQPLVTLLAAIKDNQPTREIEILKFRDGFQRVMPAENRFLTQGTDIGVINVNRTTIGRRRDGINPWHGVVVAMRVDKLIHAPRAAHGLPLREGMKVRFIRITHGKYGKRVIC